MKFRHYYKKPVSTFISLPRENQISNIKKKADESVEKLKSDISLFNETLHEVRKINNQLKSSALQLSDSIVRFSADKDSPDVKEIDDIRKNIEANTELLSIRMDAYDALFNPNTITEDMAVSIDIYKKVEKIYKCLYALRKKNNLIVEFYGHTYRSYKLRNTIELGFFIILENAMKYSPINEKIKVEFLECGDSLEVAFKSWGIRPFDGEIKKVTEKGFRSEKVKKHNIPGSGIGLYLLDQICQVNNVGLFISIGNGSKKINSINYSPFIVRLTFK